MKRGRCTISVKEMEKQNSKGDCTSKGELLLYKTVFDQGQPLILQKHGSWPPFGLDLRDSSLISMFLVVAAGSQPARLELGRGRMWHCDMINYT